MESVMIKIDCKQFIRDRSFLGFGYNQFTKTPFSNGTIIHKHTLHEWGWRKRDDSIVAQYVPMNLVLYVIGVLNKWV